MSSQPNLRLDWCSYDAAHYAATHWHYSRCLPSGKLLKIGVWENEQFLGCVIFSYGANRHLAGSFGQPQTAVCELTRIALRDHSTPVSRIVAIALRFLKQQSPGVKVVVSYADTEQGHLGKIYQAANWMYVGKVLENDRSAFIVHGRKMHPRSVGARGWTQSLKWLQEHIDPNASKVFSTGKHKYIWFFDQELKRKFAPLKMPYPKQLVTNPPNVRQPAA